MRKVILSALLLAATGFGLASCNNGAYDADPKTNNGAVLNPINPSSGVTIPIGYIQVEINGFLASFNAGIWTDSVANTAILTASRIDRPDQIQGITIMLTNYNGAGTYTVGADGAGGGITHVLYNPLDNNYIALGYTTASGAGSGTVTIEGTEDGNIRGHFEATLYQYAPDPDNNNSETITKGKFYLKKL